MLLLHSSDILFDWKILLNILVNHTIAISRDISTPWLVASFYLFQGFSDSSLYTAYNNLKVSDTSGSIGTDTEICHVTDDKLTLSSFRNNSSRISNICNKQTVPYNNSCWGSWASISSLTAISFQEFWICVVVSFGCSKTIEGYQVHHISVYN